MTPRDKDALIAGGITFMVMVLLLVLLLCCHLSWDPQAAADFSIPEEGQEELFLDPELLREQPGDDQLPTPLPEAAPTAGEPEPAPVENKAVADISTDPTAQTPKQKLVTQKQESPVTDKTPKVSEEQKKATSSIAGKFAAPNGVADGKFDSSGPTSQGSVGVAGQMTGRGFLGCPKPDVTLNHKMVVRVEVTVDASGRVTSATATAGATAAIRRACEAAAMKARWTEKKGAVSTRGSITFTITPK